MRPLDAGELSHATPIEAFTAVLLQLNVRYKTRVAVKFTGIPESSPTGSVSPMRLYDTARQEVVPFEPGPVVTMYTCGITPYDATHLGHAAVYVTYDVLQRRLRDLGHDTKCVRNITDVDDRSSRKARELGVHYLDLAAAETARFDADMEALERAAVLERAAGHVGHRRHPRLHRHGARPRPRLPGRRRGVLRRVDVPGLRHRCRTTPARRCSRYAAERGGNVDDPEQARPARLRAVAAVARRRAGVGVAVGPGPARAGTSSARRSRCASSAPPSTCTAAAPT